MGEFEKDIRDMFADLEVQVNTDALWTGIEKKLDKKDRKYPFWWIIIPVLLLVAGGVFFYQKLNIEKNKDSKNAVLIGNQTPNEAQKQNDTLKSDYNGKVHDTKKYIDKNNINRNEDKRNDVKSDNSGKIFASNKQSSNEIGVLESMTESLNRQSGKTEDEKISEMYNISKILKLKYIKGKFNLSANPQEIAYKGTFADYFERNPVPKTRNWSKSLDFSLGFALVEKTLESSDADFNDYLNRRLKTENYLEAFSFNTDFNFIHNSGFFVSSGLHYVQIDERFSDTDSIDIYKKKAGNIREIKNQDGTVSYMKGQKENISHKIWDKVIYNYYSFIDIPVVLGYRFNINNISFETSAGINYNIIFLKRGQILGTEGFPVDISKEKGMFKKQSGLSLIGGIKVLFPIKRRVFFVEPAIKYDLQDITTKDYPLSQSYFNYGIQIGYRYKY